MALSAVFQIDVEGRCVYLSRAFPKGSPALGDETRPARWSHFTLTIARTSKRH